MYGKRSAVLIFFILLSAGLLLPSLGVCGEKEIETKYAVIRILPEKIVPPTAIINLGTVVIWVNENRETAEIKFTNIDNMVVSCDGSKRFAPNSKNPPTAKLPYSELDSICLIQKGEFNYTVTRGTVTSKGTIIVK